MFHASYLGFLSHTHTFSAGWQFAVGVAMITGVNVGVRDGVTLGSVVVGVLVGVTVLVAVGGADVGGMSVTEPPGFHTRT